MLKPEPPEEPPLGAADDRQRPPGVLRPPKYVKKDSAGNVTWESGTNRAYTTGSSAGYSTSDTWE
ncbi:carbohydrate-binding module family 20 domain-containing protein [Streptomyces sp. NPDC048252]|uniref:carbohydrate-binding module family 20 domain-containing protein n=1 Tax=Streptomyces sp. NPDC048252 TaxID=3154612 RepID=UPI0034404D96